ncbi:MAG: acyl-CoA dehydrogenase family protein [Myxococcales bacterium]|nr:acyl-CoA dehydrogenase family protein [Myxococcales bacterium]MCB9756208.1 acyl-CoA dehydrogenase family protein [Myxococcales bacterium]
MDSTPSLDRFGFPLSEEQRLVREAAREFARERLEPGAAARDRERRFPRELVAELAAQGLLAMKVPVDWGGSGTDNTGYALAMQAIAESCASIAVILASSNLAASILAEHGSDAQRERWLRPYAAGELGPAAFCLTEPHAGSDAAALRTTATRDGDRYRLSGQKMWITSGAHAGLYLVFARTAPAAHDGRPAISCFVLERDTPGLEIGKDEPKMGLRSSGTVALHLDDCAIPADQRVGAEGAGYGIALGALGAGRIGIAAQSLGIAEAALRAGIEYARERVAFGQPITRFQNSRFVIADSRLELDAAWLLTLRAARLLDQGERAAMETSMAKLAASESCGRVVDRVLQLHGGYGYSEEYVIERLYRDARITRIYEGTSEIQRLVIARELLGR